MHWNFIKWKLLRQGLTTFFDRYLSWATGKSDFYFQRNCSCFLCPRLAERVCGNSNFLGIGYGGSLLGIKIIICLHLVTRGKFVSSFPIIIYVTVFNCVQEQITSNFCCCQTLLLLHLFCHVVMCSNNHWFYEYVIYFLLLLESVSRTAIKCALSGSLHANWYNFVKVIKINVIVLC
jgi:hypothetical protein